MFAAVKVVVNVFGDLAARRPAVLVFGHFQLGLEGSKARFHEGVVVAVVSAAHALTEARCADTWASVTPVVLDKFPKADRTKDRAGVPHDLRPNLDQLLFQCRQ